MIESTLTSKGQTTLPKEVREALGMKAGDRLRYFIADGEVWVVKPRPASDFFGVLKKYYEGPPVSLEEMDAGIGAHLAQKHGTERKAAAE